MRRVAEQGAAAALYASNLLFARDAQNILRETSRRARFCTRGLWVSKSIST